MSAHDGPGPEYDDVSQFDRVDRICDAYEAAWQNGQPPPLEDYLSQVSSDDRDKLKQELEGIKREYEAARERANATLRLPDATPREAAAPAEQTGLSLKIARFRIEKTLGQGGFGAVYLARDEELDRLVAVKVPHERLLSQLGDAERFLSEARTVARLDHPNIVPVFEVGRTDDCPFFLVSKYVEGTDLATRLRERPFRFQEAAELVACLADALHYAHKQGLVHRDVKPNNILLEDGGKPYVVDFGLALWEENVGKGPKFAGTPAYMSPEQARGEGHRVDGRSDIFSLGVVLYEMLTGRRPFHGKTPAELIEHVTSFEPRPLRQYDETLPQELERICQKAMAKRAGDRYSSAHDLADDLRMFLAELTPISSSETPASTPETGPSEVNSLTRTSSIPGSSMDGEPIKIVPKGLRSFDAHDADFFLELLPGPRDREGLPDSLRFWKTRIEETESDQTFSIGLIYGPSGCGKSSLVKAGLLPKLSEHIVPLYLEAAPEGTEARLLHGLQNRCQLPDKNLNLKETLQALRQGQGLSSGKKLLIVLDQFEQWLHAHKDDEDRELVEALRQCDGGRVQCLVTVRDDFWLAVSRFLRELEVPLVEGKNSAMMDLFDLHHARKVLAAFGTAFGKLPENLADASKDQKEFLREAVDGLAEEGRVICVRLALFAEMMKSKDWTRSTLKEVGGTHGVGVTFLEETFSAKSAPPEHRYHQHAARAVLKALLPETGSEIKGKMKSGSELLGASGYAHRQSDFEDLIRILDRELRLITPTDIESINSQVPDSSLSGDQEIGPTSRQYQLTHDYLIPALRQWLTQKQKETFKGRAELLLADRAAVWSARPENRQLPSFWRWLEILWFTHRKNRTPTEKQLVAKANRYHAGRIGLAIALLTVATAAGLTIRRQVIRQQEATYVSGLVESLMTAEISQVPAIVSELGDHRESAGPLLEAKFAKSKDGSSEKLHLALALLPRASAIDYLREELPKCTWNQFRVLKPALSPHQGRLVEPLWEILVEEEQNVAARFQAAAALADYAPDDPRWQTVAPFVARHLTTAVASVQLGAWLELFQPVRGSLTQPLIAIHAERTHSEKQRETAALSLADYLEDDPERLVDVVLVADERAEFSPLIEALRTNFPTVRPRLLGEFNAAMPEPFAKPNGMLSLEDRRDRNAHWKRQSLAAVALVDLGFGADVWPLLEFSSEPSLRSYVIHHLGKLGADHLALAVQLKREANPSVRRALIQALGGLDATQIPEVERNRIVAQLQAMFQQDPDPGVHSSADWAMRRWRVERPELPAGEPKRSKEQNQAIADLAAEVGSIEEKIAADVRYELPKRRTAWEEKLLEGANRAASLGEGLLAHYPLDEKEGLETANLAPGAKKGNILGATPPEWMPGVIEGAVRFLGTSGVVGAEPLELEADDAFSYGCWMSHGARLPAVLISTRNKNLGYRGFEVTLEEGYRLQAMIAGEPTSPEEKPRTPWSPFYIKVTTDRSIVENDPKAWRHVFVTYDGSKRAEGATIYLDGRRVSTTIGSNNLRGTIQSKLPVHIGSRHGSFWFSGFLDDVRVYDRRLTGEEVEALYLWGLRAVAGLHVANRNAYQSQFIAAAHRRQDEPLKRLQRQLDETKTALYSARWNPLRRWYVNASGQTMIVIPPPAGEEPPPFSHSFAIGDREVTVSDFRQFYNGHIFDWAVAPDSSCPVNSVTWYQTAEYCNWLSEREGIPEDQWVYQPNENGKYDDGMKIKEKYLELTGYRLPTEAEWNYASLAGSGGMYSFGEPVPLLRDYAWYVLNASGRSHVVAELLPNEAGLFDTHGNSKEWTLNETGGRAYPVHKFLRSKVSGGSFTNLAANARSAQVLIAPDGWYNDIGFRVAKSLPNFEE